MAKHILPTMGALALAVMLSACAGKAEYHPADQSGPQPPLPKPAQLPDAADAGAQGRRLG